MAFDRKFNSLRTSNPNVENKLYKQTYEYEKSNQKRNNNDK